MVEYMVVYKMNKKNLKSYIEARGFRFLDHIKMLINSVGSLFCKITRMPKLRSTANTN